tara:strand:+ start:1015 stop:1188 length:174 start_codon:yes stop_codon:yes gene_type:complete
MIFWMELILGFLIGCLIMIVWLAYDMARWGELVEIDITTEELESDLYSGLHLYGRDE